MESNKIINFQSLSQNVGRFSLRNKKFIIPQMNRIGSHLLAAAFRGFGIDAMVMENHKGLDLGMEYTSGKECFPCQITTGNILYFLKNEKERLGESFKPESYIYFMPEADGPCRFGMYNKYQRIILDSFDEFDRVKIGSLSSDDSYSLNGLVEEDQVRGLRKASYFSVVVADILDRLLWRVRPYEREPGSTDDFIESSMHQMEDTFAKYGPGNAFDKILSKLEDIVREGRALIDPAIPPKPLIGMVGEIYLRTQVHANQDVIRVLEKYGAEVVNASICEWVNYTTYDGLRDAKIGFRLNLKQLRLRALKEYLKRALNFGTELFYQQSKQRQVYKSVRSVMDLAEDHEVGHLEKILKERDLFSFDVGTEACLSIPGIVEYAMEGYNGVVNVYPFTCMPSTLTSAIVKPLMNKLRIPYLDTPYDSSFQPGREAAIRTFMYQAQQHLERNGRKDFSRHG